MHGNRHAAITAGPIDQPFGCNQLLLITNLPEWEACLLALHGSVPRATPGTRNASLCGREPTNRHRRLHRRPATLGYEVTVTEDVMAWSVVVEPSGSGVVVRANAASASIALVSSKNPDGSRSRHIFMQDCGTMHMMLHMVELPQVRLQLAVQVTSQTEVASPQ